MFGLITGEVVFTAPGILMLSSILESDVAVRTRIAIIRQLKADRRQDVLRLTGCIAEGDTL